MCPPARTGRGSERHAAGDKYCCSNWKPEEHVISKLETTNRRLPSARMARGSYRWWAPETNWNYWPGIFKRVNAWAKLATAKKGTTDSPFPMMDGGLSWAIPSSIAVLSGMPMGPGEDPGRCLVRKREFGELPRFRMTGKLWRLSIARIWSASSRPRRAQIFAGYRPRLHDLPSLISVSVRTLVGEDRQIQCWDIRLIRHELAEMQLDW